MVKRFFRLLYVLALIGLGLSFPVHLISSINNEDVVVATYKAKCIENSKYVVLEGSSDQYEFEEYALRDSIYSDKYSTKSTLNFYCKYYDQTQPYITAYTQAKNTSEQQKINAAFFDFRTDPRNYVSEYPALYELEVIKKEFKSYIIFGPIIEWLIYAVIAFIVLQILRISYVYIAFGQIVWHPFRDKKKQLL